MSEQDLFLMLIERGETAEFADEYVRVALLLDDISVKAQIALLGDVAGSKDRDPALCALMDYMEAIGGKFDIVPQSIAAASGAAFGYMLAKDALATTTGDDES
jgi:hypothetical protein